MPLLFRLIDAPGEYAVPGYGVVDHVLVLTPDIKVVHLPLLIMSTAQKDAQ